MDWKQYQEDAANFYRSIGLEAETDVTIEGVRTKHDVDVLVLSRHAGFEIKWIVECKHWDSKVTKLHVLALREIVSDTGADRGIILAENGYQSGAFEAASLTNVRLSSLAEMRGSAKNEIFAMRLRDIYDRVVVCKKMYWDIPKSVRTEHDLRPEVSAVGYSGDWAIKVVEDIVSKGFRGKYPICPESDHLMIGPTLAQESLPNEIKSLKELVEVAEEIVTTLETKIRRCLDLSARRG